MKIMISGGGTGGHIYPALALIHEIKKQDPQTEFLYVGTENGLENKIISKTDIPFQTIEIQGFKRSLSKENIQTVRLFLKSVKKVKQMIKDFQPDIVIGTGGYVSGAVVYAAARMHIPTIIHEQNSVAGITNKFLSKFADKVAICFEDVAPQFPSRKVVLTGNPRGQEVAGLQKTDILSEKYQLSDTIPTILIFGGSRGAEKINQSFVEVLPELASRNYQVIFVSGEIHFDKIKTAVADQVLHDNNIVIRPYIEDMPKVMASVDGVLSRAGATTLAELTALGVPSILIPSPYVTNNHQVKNATSLEKNRAAYILTEDELSGDSLLAIMDKLMNHPDKRQEMAENAYDMGIRNASQRMIDMIESLTNQPI